MNKSELLTVMQMLPEDGVSIDDVVKVLLLVEKVKESNKGRRRSHTISHEEAKRIVMEAITKKE